MFLLPLDLDDSDELNVAVAKLTLIAPKNRASVSGCETSQIRRANLQRQHTELEVRE